MTSHLTEKYIFECKLKGEPIRLADPCDTHKWATYEDIMILRRHGILKKLSNGGSLVTWPIEYHNDRYPTDSPNAYSRFEVGRFLRPK